MSLKLYNSALLLYRVKFNYIIRYSYITTVYLSYKRFHCLISVIEYPLPNWDHIIFKKVK